MLSLLSKHQLLPVSSVARYPKTCYTKNLLFLIPFSLTITMYQNSNHHHQPHSPTLLISSPAKYNDSRLLADDVSSLGQVVKKFNGLIDSSNFLQTDKVVVAAGHQPQSDQEPDSESSEATKSQSRSEPIDIPKAGQRPPLPYHYDDDFREGECPVSLILIQSLT